MAPRDVEAILAAFLPDADTKVPDPRPASFTRVTAAGGSRPNLIQGVARVIVEGWGDTEEDAWAQTENAWNLLDAAHDSFIQPGAWVSRIELTYPARNPDRETATPRYQFIAQLTLSLTEVPA